MPRYLNYLNQRIVLTNRVFFTGSTTWQVPADVRVVYVTMVGAGGSGGGGSFQSTNPNYPGYTGSAGGTTSFGTYLSAVGGSGGTGGAAHGGVGGAGGRSVTDVFSRATSNGGLGNPPLGGRGEAIDGGPATLDSTYSYYTSSYGKEVGAGGIHGGSSNLNAGAGGGLPRRAYVHDYLNAEFQFREYYGGGGGAGGKCTATSVYGGGGGGGGSILGTAGAGGSNGETGSVGSGYGAGGGGGAGYSPVNDTGGGGGGGGGGSGFIRRRVAVIPSETITITIGAPGLPVTNGSLSSNVLMSSSAGTSGAILLEW